MPEPPVSVSLPPPPLSVLPDGAAVSVSANAEPVAVEKPPTRVSLPSPVAVPEPRSTFTPLAAPEYETVAPPPPPLSRTLLPASPWRTLPEIAGAVTFWIPDSESEPPSPSLEAAPGGG